jgi:DNA mismatch repair protein MutL
MSNEERRIQVLPPAEARRIAAGEVIDRPAALVREFLDNAIDAGGHLIEVLIEEGGISRIEVVDDGGGMGKEDLELCHLAHATSKIRCLDDLKTAVTLGFRGEALAAAAAVSRLEILSSRDGREAWKLCVGPGEKNPPNLEQSRRAKGTSVRALGLYDTIPARKRFLKRAGSEGAACRQIFNEKALAFPGIAFRFSQDGILKSFLPSVSSLKDRFSQLFLEERESAFLHEITAIGKGFSVSVVAGGPELSRSDRRLQFVYANNRRIQDYSLLQALEYGLQGWFPNATHPIGAVFITIDPALADCNIHPAKREVRFADSGAIHHALSSALRDFSRHATLAEKASELTAEIEFTPTELASDNNRRLDQRPRLRSTLDAIFAAEEAVPYSASETKPEPDKSKAHYLGRLFDLFILIEKNDALFVIDQHAAHERILYDRFLSGSIPKQELLVAIPFITESQRDDSFLEEKREELAKLGIAIKRNEDEWLIEALPSGWKLSDKETVEEILNLKNANENPAERWAATYSCRSAVKDGDFLDEITALALAEEALTLPVSRCPHGRPIWLKVSRDDLFKAVKRN